MWPLWNKYGTRYRAFASTHVIKRELTLIARSMAARIGRLILLPRSDGWGGDGEKERDLLREVGGRGIFLGGGLRLRFFEQTEQDSSEQLELEL